MLIIKHLKHGEFTFDDESNSFSLWADQWNKIYVFAFVRFFLRIAQRNWMRRIKNGK